MAAIDLKQLVGHLNDTCRRALEAAAGLTLSRTHYNVEIEHWLVTLADRPTATLPRSCEHYEIDMGRFATDLNRVAGEDEDRQLAARRRWRRTSSSWCKQAWLFASLEQNAVRSCAPAICCGRCWPMRRWRGMRARHPASC